MRKDVLDLSDDSNSETSSEQDYEDDAILDLPSNSDSEEYYEQNDENVDFSEEEEEEEKWGRSKKNYYEADVDAGQEEAIEASRIHKKRLASLKEQDFGIHRSSKGDKNIEKTVYFSESEQEDQEEQVEVDDGGLEEFNNLIADFKDKLRLLKEHLEPLLTKLGADVCKDEENGHNVHVISFLRIKHKLLLAYCTYVAYYLTIKLEGKQRIEGHPVLDRLVEYRLLLEKISPIETRLQPQMDKLLEAAIKADRNELTTRTGVIEFLDDEQDVLDNADEEELMTRPHLNDFVESQVESEDEIVKQRGNKYVPPRITPNALPEGTNEKQRSKRTLKSRLLREFDEELSEESGHVEEESIDPYIRQSSKSLAEKEAYEEENMLRFAETRKDKKESKKTARLRDDLDDLNEFFDQVKDIQYPQSKKTADTEKVAGKKGKNKKSYDDDKNQDDSLSEIEDDLPPLAKKPKKSKSVKGTTKYRPIEDLDSSKAIRPATYQILRNRGLTPNRPKEYRNPRVHNRRKFERSQQKLGSFKPLVKKEKFGKYSGETSGIRTNLSRSVRF